MSLDQELWSPVAFDHVVLAFLSGEWHKFAPLAWHNRSLVTDPDLQSPLENTIRLLLLQSIRGGLLMRIPVTTKWFRVSSLQRDHLNQLLVIGRCNLAGTEDGHGLREVAAQRAPEELLDEPQNWASPILWGHAPGAPLSILEGNHRLLAYAATSHPPVLDIDCYVGLSEDLCCWHSNDEIGS